jgi:dienelactone hydrolase
MTSQSLDRWTVKACQAVSRDYLQMLIYGNTRHGFTNPDAGKYGMAALAYNPSSDRRSWQHMTLIFHELFPKI